MACTDRCLHSSWDTLKALAGGKQCALLPQHTVLVVPETMVEEVLVYHHWVDHNMMNQTIIQLYK